MAVSTGKLFLDSHCHLQDPRLVGRIETVLRVAHESGVRYFVSNGTTEDDWLVVRDLSNKYPVIIPSFGLHPWFVGGKSVDWLTRLRTLLHENPNAFVGEAGLDNGSKGKQISMELQKEALESQLCLAKEFNRPISLHCVRAFGEMLQVLKPFGDFPAGIVMHSYMGSAETAKQLVNHGAYFSISGFVLGLSTSKARKMLQAIPTDRLLLETDAPDGLPAVDPSRLASVHSEGAIELLKVNHPVNIRIVAEIIAELLGVPVEDICDRAYENSLRLFKPGIPPL